MKQDLQLQGEIWIKTEMIILRAKIMIRSLVVSCTAKE